MPERLWVDFRFFVQLKYIIFIFTTFQAVREYLSDERKKN